MHKFSIKEAVKLGFKVAKKNILFFLGIFVITIFISSIGNSLQSNLEEQMLLFTLVSLIFWVISIILDMGILRINLKFIDSKKPKYKDLFVLNWKAILNYILSSILVGLIVLIGFILLIVPGIILAIRLQYSGYLIVDKNLGAIEAIKKSWKITKGNAWHLFAFSLAIIGINIIGLLALVIGLLVTVPLSMVASAFVFRKLLALK